MSQIVTLTFNPCIDKSSSISGLAPEKKLRCSPPEFGPGGGGINVSRALKNLGTESLAIYPSGGYSGKFLNQLMELGHLQYRTVETATHTRENFIAFDKATELQYRFGMPGSEISESEWKALLAELEKTEAAYIVASGSLLPGMPADIVAQVARIAREKGARLILDTSGEALQKALDVGVYLLKPNLGELSSLVGQEEVHHDTVDSLAKEIIKRGQCEVIVVSLGAKGAKMITKNEIIHVPSPVVKSVSTVGAGDSMVAGMVLALSENKPLKEVLQLGVACGTAATLTHGSELCRKEDVERIYRCIAGAEAMSLKEA
jgi:6-phosphofructokinase 2